MLWIEVSFIRVMVNFGLVSIRRNRNDSKNNEMRQNTSCGFMIKNLAKLKPFFPYNMTTIINWHHRNILKAIYQFSPKIIK